MDLSTDLAKTRVDPLQGMALAIYALAIILGLLSLVVVSLRTILRLQNRAIGWDDWFMAAGMVVYAVECVLSCLGARAGLGTRNRELSPAMHVDAMMFLMIWMLLYISSLLLIKISICITMLRIAGSVRRLFRVAVWANLAVIIGTFLTTFIGVLLLCSPVEANWNSQLVLDGKARCASMYAMIGLSYTSTSATIATDIACAVLPGLILWRTQMKTRTKWGIIVLLSFGSFASITTMIRTPYIAYYRNPLEDLPFYTGHIVLWSNIETSIGLIAGSLPSLRQFFVNVFNIKSSTHDSKKTPQTPGIVTFGSLPANPSRSRKIPWGNPTDGGVSTATVGEASWERLSDSSATPVVENDIGSKGQAGADDFKRKGDAEGFGFEMNRL